MSDLNLYSVNWQDGMLIGQRHLKDQEKYFEDLIRWHAIHTGDGFGLVSRLYAGQPALNMNLAVDGNRLRVEIVRCHALTPGGYYIEINDTSGINLRADCEITDSEIPVFLGVDPAAKNPVGQPDPEEDLPRIPYLVKQYLLTLNEPANLPDENLIQIAQLVASGNEVSQSPNYYPPCITVSADERLSKKVTDYKNKLENLLSYSSRAFMAMASEGALASENTNLQAAYRETMHQFVYSIASTLDEFAVGHRAYHPLRMVINIKKLFRIFSSLLNMQPGLKDYLNERYFLKERKLEAAQFLSLIDSFLLSDYNHRDIGGQISKIDSIFDELRGLLGFLAKTKREELGAQAVATETLTYLSRSYKIADYGSCNVEQVGGLTYLMLDIKEPRPVSDTVILMAKDIFGAAWANIQVRLGLNEARGLGETDPVDIDTTTFGNKVALHPQDMLQSQSVRQMTLIIRGAGETGKLSDLTKSDLIIYST
jgi:hypothetical protein